MEFIPGSEQLFDITRGRYRCILSLLLKREVVWNLELLSLFAKDCLFEIVWGSKLHFVAMKTDKVLILFLLRTELVYSNVLLMRLLEYIFFIKYTLSNISEAYFGTSSSSKHKIKLRFILF